MDVYQNWWKTPGFLGVGSPSVPGPASPWMWDHSQASPWMRPGNLSGIPGWELPSKRNTGNHGIQEWVGLEGTFRGRGQGHLPLAEVAPSALQPDLELFQGCGICQWRSVRNSESGQSPHTGESWEHQEGTSLGSGKGGSSGVHLTRSQQGCAPWQCHLLGAVTRQDSPPGRGEPGRFFWMI